MKFIKFNLITSISLLATAFLTVGLASVQAQVSNGSDDASASVTSATVSNGSDDSSTSATVSNGSDDSSAPATVVPASPTTAVTTVSNGSDDSPSSSSSGSSGTSVTTISNGNDDGSSASTPVTPPSNPSGGSTSSSSSGSSSSSSGSSGSYVGGFIITPAAVTASASTSSCPLIAASLLEIGAQNDGSQVAKLQSFLKDSQGLNVDVNGIYDTKTEAAVSAFQVKYLSDIMGPWGATQSSGIAYITTIKKVNELACNTPLNLTPAELSVINAYKASLNASSTGTSPVESVPSTINATGTPLIGAGPVLPGTNDNSANTASVVNASIFQRFWNFIKNIF